MSDQNTEFTTMPGAQNPKDYIPIHTSDRQQFKRCRRRWDWNSPSRQNLVPNRAQSGVIFPLWFGTGIHAALEYYYAAQTDVPMEPAGLTSPDVFVMWYNLEMQKLTTEAPQWYDEHADELMEHFELGIGMLDNYELYAKEHDNFRVIATEHDFAVPLGISMYDWRAGYVLPVRYAGRQDLIIQDLETGTYGIMDHKTAADMGEDYFQKLELDEQCTSYLWAATQEQGLLPSGAKPSFVLYNVLRKAKPQPPTMLQNGKLSISRSNESTTIDLWNQTLDANDLRDTDWHQQEKVQMYEEYLRQAGWGMFFKRQLVLRNEHEIHMIGEQIKLEAEDMLGLPNIYPNPTGDWYCLKCPFRAPCLATNDGSDVNYMLSENYTKNYDR